MRWVVALMLSAGLLGVTREGRAGPRYEVEARVDASRRRVEVSESIEGVEASGGAISLWFYADRMRHRPPSFDEFSADRLFVFGDSRGGVGEATVQVEGCAPQRVEASTQASSGAVRGRQVQVAVCEAASKPLRLRLRATLSLARRYGTLGYGDDTVALGDPWYPLVMAAGGPERASHRVKLRVEGGGVLVGPGEAVRGEQADFSRDDATHLPLFVLDGGHIRREVSRGVEVIHVTRRAPVERGTSNEDPLRDGDVFDPDAARQIQATTQQAVALLRRLRFTAAQSPAPRAMAGRLTVVEVNERQRLAVALPGLVAVSDRAFRVLKTERVRRFHRVAMARQVFAALLEPHARATEAPRDEAWARDMSGALLSEWMLEFDGSRRESPDGLLGAFSFMPSIDQLLYAPQVPFRSVYFHESDESDPDRDGAERALDERPWGGLLYEKFLDRVGMARARRAGRRALEGGLSWRAAVAAETGQDERWFFEQWLAGRRRLAYRLGEVRSEQEGGRWRHRIAVERLGDTAVREPVVVEVEDQQGAKVIVVWDAPGARGEVEAVTSSALRNVVIDPAKRLVQDPSLSDNHPRHDDRLVRDFRLPILNNVSLNASVAEARPGLDAELLIKRQYEVRRAHGVRVSAGFRGYTGGIRFVWGLGPMRDLNNTVANLSAGVTFLRSTTGFGGAAQPVSGGTFDVAFVHDRRLQKYAAATGQSFSISASLGAARPDDDRARPLATIALRGQALAWPHVQHILSLTYGAAAVNCPALPQFLPALSGRQGFRGYELDELIGCSTVYAIAEERWAVVKGPYVSNAGISWSHKLELVPFVGVGALSSQQRATDLFRRWLLDAGLGVRVHFDNFGVAPSVLALDVGWPFGRRDACRLRGDGGVCLRERFPVGIYASFEQTF